MVQSISEDNYKMKGNKIKGYSTRYSLSGCAHRSYDTLSRWPATAFKEKINIL